MSKWLLAPLALAVLSASTFAQDVARIDPAALGATATTINNGGQTFLDIGTTLREPRLQGVNLTISSAGAYSTRGGCAACNYQAVNGTVQFVFSVPLHVRFEGGPSLLPGEFDSFGPPVAGSLRSSHSEPGLVVGDDSVRNPTQVRILTNRLVWKAHSPGTTWSHTALSGNQGGALFVVFACLTGAGSGRVGTTMRFTLSALGDGGLRYQLASSLGPGPTPLAGRTIGLSVDPIFFASVYNLAPSVFTGYAGTLNPQGQANAALDLPALAALAGTTVYTAFATISAAAPSGVRSISETHSFTIQP